MNRQHFGAQIGLVDFDRKINSGRPENRVQDPKPAGLWRGDQRPAALGNAIYFKALGAVFDCPTTPADFFSLTCP